MWGEMNGSTYPSAVRWAADPHAARRTRPRPQVFHRGQGGCAVGVRRTHEGARWHYNPPSHRTTRVEDTGPQGGARNGSWCRHLAGCCREKLDGIVGVDRPTNHAWGTPVLQ